MNRRAERYHNIFFPLWFLFLFPPMWVLVLPVNFVIDWMVLILAMKAMGIDERRARAKSVILMVWAFGFVADLIGSAVMFLTAVVEPFFGGAFAKWWNDSMVSWVFMNPFQNVYSFLWVTGCVLLSGFCIYLFNAHFCLKKLDIDPAQRKRLALSLAIFTAPYLFYFPSELLYR